MRFGLSDNVVSELQGVFRQFPKVHEVRIFGSRAKGNYTEGSDIDLAVVYDGDSHYVEMMEMDVRIDDLALLYKVDLLDYKRYEDTPIGEHVRRVGKLFYKSDTPA